jgi:acetyl-CoA acyltransferase 1
MAMFLAGFPETVPISTLNRQCSSGLQAFASVAAAITSGFYEVGIAAGIEHMTTKIDNTGPEFAVSPNVAGNKLAKDCLLSMGQTSENVSERYNIPRDKQDLMGSESNRKAIQAEKEGRFKNEIVPVKTKFVDKEGKEGEIVVTKDDGPRPGSTPEVLAKLKPAFKKDGKSTAGNSSQVSDGAAAVLVMKRSKAQELKLPIQGVFRGFAVAGVPPDVMGIGPAFAIPPALEKAGLKLEDIDVFEINEAFASQAVYCVEKLGIPMEKVNPNGGAIALGHPLAATGARQIATLLNELKLFKKRYGVVSMCIGTGMGAAGVFEVE